jgi:phage baseplate assembly protein V
MVMREFQKLAAPLARRIRLSVGRGIVRLVNDALKLQAVQVSLLADETQDNVERFQEYGFTSHPFPGAEAIVVCVGGSRDHAVVIAIDDRRYRLKAIAPGEVALYDDQEQVVHLKRDKHIHVYGADRLTADVAEDVVINTSRAAVNASESCIVTSPLVKAVASTQVILDTPLTSCTGDLAVAGGVTCSGTYGASGGRIQTPGDIQSTGGEVSDQVRSMAADRDIYNGHTHPGDSGGTTGAPNQGM